MALAAEAMGAEAEAVAGDGEEEEEDGEDYGLEDLLYAYAEGDRRVKNE